ncbi:MAG: amidophosphoribosyltransferase [Candidatus Bathyarchaeia archaeon]
MTEVRENCGVIAGQRLDGDIASSIWLGLLALQHRGQEACGIYTLDGKRFYHRKQLGLIEKFQKYDHLKGSLGIGHVRYSTVGQPANQETESDQAKIEDFAQPYFSDRQKGGIALCHNGNLVNFATLCADLQSEGTFLTATCDTEVILKIFVEALSRDSNIERAVQTCMRKFEGSYSVVAITGAGEVVGFRDPHGFRPLCFGENGNLLLFASESVALDVNGIHEISNVKPGEVVIMQKGKTTLRKQLVTQLTQARCMFEYVYFSRPDSTIDQRDVYSVRIKLGRNLARTYKSHADVIVPVPDTARPAAEGISRETGIPVLEGLIKNRYVGRTFIMPKQDGRETAVRLKLNVVRTVVHQKNVLLVDDSIVRGTTMRKIVNLLKDAGAARVEVWITCPPIKSPCFYGIDMTSYAELVASNSSVEEVRRAVGADELCYQTIDGLLDAIGFTRSETCLACLTGQYPTPLAQKLANEMRGKEMDGQVRYWEAHQ